MTGTLEGFRRCGWDVHPYIVGDFIPQRVSGPGSARNMNRNALARFATDAVRIAASPASRRAAWRTIGGKVTFVYERFATLQSLGRIFKRRGIPWVLETNGIFFREAAEDRGSLVLRSLAERTELDAYRECDALVCVSDQLAEEAVRLSGISEDKVLVLPNAVAQDRFDAVGVERPYPPDVFTLGFAGSLLRWQGIDQLLLALHRVQNRGLRVATTIVGDGPELGRLQHLATSLSIDAHFTGLVPWGRIPGLIAGFDAAFCGHHATWGEHVYHSPIKLYEYLAAGVPVIAADFQEAERLLGESDAGRTYATGDVEDLAIKIGAMVAMDPTNLAAMGDRGRHHVLSHHTWEVRVRELLDGLGDRFLGNG